jgi:WD40 repeat protein
LDKKLKLWKVSTGECLKTLKGHSGPVLSVCFSKDDKLVVIGSADTTLRLWNVSTGECIKILEGHSGAVWSAGFSKD